jgi:hypothetical protein
MFTTVKNCFVFGIFEIYSPPEGKNAIKKGLVFDIFSHVSGGEKHFFDFLK